MPRELEKTINRYSADLLHYGNHIFYDIFPLTYEEYSLISLARRAYNDYFCKIVENLFKAFTHLCNEVFIIPLDVQNYRNVFEASKAFMSQEVINRLQIYYKYRHNLTHDMKQIDNQKLYLTMSDMIILGVGGFFLIRELGKGNKFPIVNVNKHYFLNQINEDKYIEERFLKYHILKDKINISEYKDRLRNRIDKEMPLSV